MHNSTGQNSLAVALFNTMVGTVGGFLSFMDGHQWVAILITGLGASIISTAGAFAIKRYANQYRKRCLIAEAELRKLKQKAKAHHTHG